VPTTKTGTQVYLTYNEMRLIRDAIMGYVWGEKDTEWLDPTECGELDKKLDNAQNRVLDKRLEEGE